MYNITSQKNYLLVRFTDEIRYSQIVAAIEELLAREDFPQWDDIWVFEGRLVDIRYEQLDTLIQAILSRYPMVASRSKTALVTATGFMAAIAEEFLRLARILPYELQLFHSLEDAENWLQRPTR